MGITKQQALEMLQSDDLVGIGMAAHQLRLQKNDPRIATYQIDRNINVGSSRVDLQACKLEYSIVSPK